MFLVYLEFDGFLDRDIGLEVPYRHFYLVDHPYLLAGPSETHFRLEFMKVVGLDVAEEFGSGQHFRRLFCLLDLEADFESNGEEDVVIDGSFEYDFLVFFEEQVFFFFPTHEEPGASLDYSFFPAADPIVFGFDSRFHNFKLLQMYEIYLLQMQLRVMTEIEFC